LHDVREPTSPQSCQGVTVAPVTKLDKYPNGSGNGVTEMQQAVAFDRKTAVSVIAALKI
jgi:hypothetical protein